MHDSGYSVDMIIKAAFEYELNNYINSKDSNIKYVIPEPMVIAAVKQYMNQRVKQIKETHK